MDLPDRDKKKSEGDAAASSKAKTATGVRASQSADKDLRTRLVACFERIADSAEARGDVELAAVVRDDMQVMATGLVSFTRPFRVLRTPIVLLLSIVEPVMAFSRIGRLFLERLMVRRSEKHAQTEPVE